MKNGVALTAWSSRARRIPDSINSQLLGTFPSIVKGDDGATTCAFFVRAAEQEFSKCVASGSATTCLVKPQFVKTPQGPIVVAYCMVMASQGLESLEPFVSETAIFPRLSSMPQHRDVYELLLSRNEAYYVVCDEKGNCIFNSRARVMDEWRAELVEKGKGFDEGKQVSDEKCAIMSLYWYQERYSGPSGRIFEVRHTI